MNHILKTAGICVIIGATIVFGVGLALVLSDVNLREMAEENNFRAYAIDQAREHCDLGSRLYAMGVVLDVTKGEITEEQGHVMMEYFHKYCP